MSKYSRKWISAAAGAAAIACVATALTATSAVAAPVPSTVPAVDAVGAEAPPVFPGPQPGLAEVNVTDDPDGQLVTLGNDVIEASWQLAAGGPRLASLENLVDGVAAQIAGGSMLKLTLADGSVISGTAFQPVGQIGVADVAADGDAVRGAERDAGRAATATYRYTDGTRTLEVDWTVLLRNGSHSVQQRLELRAVTGDFAIRSLGLTDIGVAGARIVGHDDGSPVVLGTPGSESFFLGVENPMSKPVVTASGVTISLPRATNLTAGTSAEYTSAVGVVAPGQLRRSFLAYVERERAHTQRPFLHYQTWFDLKPPGLVINAAELTSAINLFGSEMSERGAHLDSFWIDDGWDYLRAPAVSPEPDVWSFDPTQFPNGFAEQKEAAAQYGGSLSVWMSPFGGYGDSASRRLAINSSKPVDERYGLTGGRFALSDPDYAARFQDVVFEMMDEQGVRGFKFDGIGGGLHQTGPNPAYLADYEVLLQLMSNMREHQPEVWINATVGTWGSPYWLWYVDSIWRDGDDASQAGSGSPQQRYVNYRDSQTYRNIAAEAPLFPVPAVMNHGIIFSDRAPQFTASHDLTNETVRAEVSQDIRSYFAQGLGLQELYIRNTLVKTDVPGADWFWDTLAENAKWSRDNSGLLGDVHWVGGDAATGQVYGTAAWSPEGDGHGMLMLRNPSTRPQSITLDVGQTLELPASAATTWSFTEKDGLRNTFVAAAGTPRRITLQPFEVAVFSAAPSTQAPTPDDPEVAQPLDRTGWTATADSQEINGENGRAANVLDGNAGTFWHTAYTSGIAPLPHQITLDLGAAKEFGSLEYTPRQDGGRNGIISTYQVLASTDGSNWGAPIATGAFDGTSAVQLVSVPPTTARYVRLVATGSANGAAYSGAAELNLYPPSAPTLDVEVVADTRCIASKAYVTVKATNGESVPIALNVRSPYGDRAFASVAPDKNAVHSFAARAADVPAGSVAFDATRVIDGSTVTVTGTAAYGARSCG